MPAVLPMASDRTQPEENDYVFHQRLHAARKPAAVNHHRGAIRAAMAAERLPGRHPGHLGGTDAKGGGLLQRRCDGAAPPRAGSKDRSRIKELQRVQRTDCAAAPGRAQDDHPGRRVDLLRPGKRSGTGGMAGLRHAAHADGAQSETGSDHDRHRDHANLRCGKVIPASAFG